VNLKGLPLAELAVSASGIVFLIKIMEYEPAPDPGTSLATWALFTVIALLGAVATILPHRCTPTLRISPDLPPSRASNILGIAVVHGHHTDCGHFDDHELIMGGKRVCAGCLGLLAGATAAILITTAHFMYDAQIPKVNGYIGLALVALGLGHKVLPMRVPPSLSVLLNALLVTSYALILVAVNGEQGVNLMTITIAVYWTYTRIRLSTWSHDQTCDGCPEEECEKRE